MYRVGIIGTGQMAATMVEAMGHSPDLSPVAVLSGDAGRAKGFAQGFGLEAGFGDLAGFTAAGLDLVYIANANDAHMQAAMSCIDAGLPVFVEKPMGLDAAQVEAILTRAKAQGVLVVENLWVLALPAYRALKEVAQSGQYGAVKALSFDFSLPVSAGQMPGLFATRGGGVLRDRAVYGLAMALDLLGPVAQTRSDMRSAGVETSAALQLTHEGGAVSQISVSFDAVGRNDLSLSLEQAALRLGPGLAAEHLAVSQYGASDAARAQMPAPSAGLKQRLKQQPLLRRLKAKRAAAPGQFHSYGASPYSPILQELTRALQGGGQEAACVPWALSRAVAQLVGEIAPVEAQVEVQA